MQNSIIVLANITIHKLTSYLLALVPDYFFMIIIIAWCLLVD